MFINVPVLKHHSSSMLTIGMKNLMGVVWDRGYWHGHSLMQCIADMATYRKPDLTVVDAYRVMTRNGPRGISEADVMTLKTQLLSTDPVAADAAAAKLFDAECLGPKAITSTKPEEVPYIVKAAQAKLGSMDLAALDIRRIAL